MFWWSQEVGKDSVFHTGIQHTCPCDTPSSSHLANSHGTAIYPMQVSLLVGVSLPTDKGMATTNHWPHGYRGPLAEVVLHESRWPHITGLSICSVPSTIADLPHTDTSCRSARASSTTSSIAVDWFSTLYAMHTSPSRATTFIGSKPIRRLFGPIHIKQSSPPMPLELLQAMRLANNASSSLLPSTEAHAS